jgi:hypothetical protein
MTARHKAVDTANTAGGALITTETRADLRLSIAG